MVMNPVTEHEQQTIMLGKLCDLLRLPMTRNVSRGSAKYATIVGGHRQCHQTRITGLAIAQSNIHRLAKQVGETISQQ
ncbi:hypothetical protein D3C76_1077140 [compost metagenome]